MFDSIAAKHQTETNQESAIHKPLPVIQWKCSSQVNFLAKILVVEKREKKYIPKWNECQL